VRLTPPSMRLYRVRIRCVKGNGDGGGDRLGERCGMFPSRERERLLGRQDVDLLHQSCCVPIIRLAADFARIEFENG
jgi:hypothetical protein